jgi:hypothetical protein
LGLGRYNYRRLLLSSDLDSFEGHERDVGSTICGFMPGRSFSFFILLLLLILRPSLRQGLARDIIRIFSLRSLHFQGWWLSPAADTMSPMPPATASLPPATPTTVTAPHVTMRADHDRRSRLTRLRYARQITPTDCCEACDSNDGAGQGICQEVAATHYSHCVAPLSEYFSIGMNLSANSQRIGLKRP